MDGAITGGPVGAREVLEADSQAERAILEGALDVFSSYGYARTSMSAIARAASLSRTALYRHFSCKEHVFRELVLRLHQECLQRSRRVLDGSEDLDARLRGLLAAKALFFHELLEGSRHGAELLGEHQRLSIEAAQESRDAYLELVARAFRDAARSGEIELRPTFPSARAAAEHLYLSAQGLEGEAELRTDTATYRRRLDRLVTVMVRALTPAPSGR